MRKSAFAPIAALFCFVTASCHRPYARYQPIPIESFRSSGIPKPVIAETDSVVVQALEWPRVATVPSEAETPLPELYASSAVVPPSRSVQHHARQAASTLVHQGANAFETNALPQPRPKTGKKKTLREILGLKPRKKLNWWQRIPWQLKASIPVIGVAIVFAVLNITILAIIFGVLGAFLLIRGMKRSFKVRRPWF